MKLRDWQRKRLEELRNCSFPASRYAKDVTLIAYTFPSDPDSEAFDWIECAILQSWAILGKLPTVLIAHHHFQKLDSFAKLHDGIEIQIEPSLEPGHIETMSADCDARLYQRFNTAYCLIVQDDGFPLHDTLGDFIGKYDFVGAPYVRLSWWRNIVSRIIGLHMANGGFSLRSRRICKAAAELWNRKYKRIHPSRATVDDIYYTQTLPLRHPLFRLRFRIAPNTEAIYFAYDAIVTQKTKQLPFGFHRASTFEILDKEFNLD